MDRFLILSMITILIGLTIAWNHPPQEEESVTPVTLHFTIYPFTREQTFHHVSIYDGDPTRHGNLLIQGEVFPNRPFSTTLNFQEKPHELYSISRISFLTPDQ